MPTVGIARTISDAGRNSLDVFCLGVLLSVVGAAIVVATGNTVAAAIAEKNPGRAPVLKFVIKDSPCYVGMNKDEPKLMAKVNEIITKAKADGEIAKLSEKWLKNPLPPGF